MTNYLIAVVTAGVACFGVVVRELPRLYWLYGQIRLAKKGEMLAATVADVRELMAGLTQAGELLRAEQAARVAPPDAEPGE